MALYVPPCHIASCCWSVLAVSFPRHTRHCSGRCVDGTRHALLRRRWHTARSSWALTAPTRSRAVPTWQTCWPSRATRCGLIPMSAGATACSAQADSLMPSVLAAKTCKLRPVSAMLLLHSVFSLCYLCLIRILPQPNLCRYILTSVWQPLPCPSQAANQQDRSCRV